MLSCRRLLVATIAVAALAACGRRSEDRAPRDNPAAPSPAGAPSTTIRVAPHFSDPQAVAFPPRNEPFDFGTRLNDKYRDQLRAAAVASFVNLEGYIVWIQEYLRYRVSGCSHETAVQKVFSQIDGAGIAADCGAAAAQSFPPRNEPFDFGNRLNDKYRDQLHAAAVVSFVNLEGYIVWIQEYLRYRVSGCGHETAVQKVFAQIDGGGIAPDCTPVPTPTPCTVSLSATSQNVVPGGATQSVGVVASATTCTWTAAAASGPPAWMTINSGGSGTGSANITYTATPNNTTSARSGTITIQASSGSTATLTVTQASNVTPTSASFQLFDLDRTASATTRCEIHNVPHSAAGNPTTCTLDASGSTSASPITSYTWSIQYTYNGAQNLTRTGSRVTFQASCDGNGGQPPAPTSTQRVLTVQLTIRDSAGNQATATSGAGPQAALQIVTFT